MCIYILLCGERRDSHNNIRSLSVCLSHTPTLSLSLSPPPLSLCVCVCVCVCVCALVHPISTYAANAHVQSPRAARVNNAVISKEDCELIVAIKRTLMELECGRYSTHNEMPLYKAQMGSFTFDWRCYPLSHLWRITFGLVVRERFIH